MPSKDVAEHYAVSRASSVCMDFCALSPSNPCTYCVDDATCARWPKQILN
jgi:hypothetical protein